MWLGFGKDVALPTGLVRVVKDEPARRDLQPLRAFIPKILVSEEGWKTMRVHPVSTLDVWTGRLQVRSSSGWTKNKVKNWKSEAEIFLLGHRKVEKSDVDQFLQLSGRQALFADKLAKDQKVRPKVGWKEKSSRNPLVYHLEVLKEAADSGSALAFRVGGGNFPGVRLHGGAMVQVIWRASCSFELVCG